MSNTSIEGRSKFETDLIENLKSLYETLHAYERIDHAHAAKLFGQVISSMCDQYRLLFNNKPVLEDVIRKLNQRG